MPAPTEEKAVVLVVDKYSLDVHLAYSTAGVKYPVRYNRGNRSISYTKEFFSILADLSNVKPGVRVFFYKRRIDEVATARGFLGEWRAIDEPYEDLNTDLPLGNRAILGHCPNCQSPVSELQEGTPRCKECYALLPGHILPLRFTFAKETAFSRYLDDNTAYIDLTDSGRLSTLIFRKIYGAGRERSVNPILPEEAVKLRRLLERVENTQANQRIPSPPQIATPTPKRLIKEYLNFQRQIQIARRGTTHLYTGDGALLYETILEFWLIQELSQRPDSVLQRLDVAQGETVEWFSNQVLFGIGGEKSDVLILTRNADGLRCRAIVVELKKDSVNNDTLNQVRAYAYWIAQLVTAQVETSRPFTITPVAIGHRVARNAQPFAPFSFVIPYSHPLEVQAESPRVYTYTVDTAANTLLLNRER